ncbi:MAG TPA: GNAT family N-acetyltransferase [Kofleriaceae bacterium]|nr:GNAT family N-acetyltransferase [Kofleriaceae bacterium]
MQRRRELSSGDPFRVELRRAQRTDLPFLEDVHVEALGPVALIGYGWPAVTLREQFRREIEVATCHVISIDGRRAGYISVEDRDSYWYIDAIAISRRYQGKGIGTIVLRNVLAEASTRAVRLNVLHVNRARALYERLGFRAIRRDEHRQIMEWRPPEP